MTRQLTSVGQLNIQMWTSIVVASILMLILGIVILNVGQDAAIVGTFLILAIPAADFGLFYGFTKKKRTTIDTITSDLVKYIQDHKDRFYPRGVRPKVGQCGIFWEFEANRAF